jgi:hypothetical protein
MTFRSGVAKPPKIAQVSVSAALDANAARRSRGQIASHGQRGSTIKRKGRARHAPMTKRKEFAHAALFRL